MVCTDDTRPDDNDETCVRVLVLVMVRVGTCCVRRGRQ